MLRHKRNLCVYTMVLVWCACASINDNEHFDYNNADEFNYTETDLGSIDLTNYVETLKITPVKLSEFRRKIRHTYNRYDLMRIFFEDTDLPEEYVDDLIDAGSMQSDYYDDVRDDLEPEVLDPEVQVHGNVQLPMGDYDLYDMDGIDAVYAHIDELEAHPIFQCRLPQPEIFKVPSHAGRLYYPECIVVHRCRNISGCCPYPEQECGPKTIKIYKRPFLVLEVLKGGGGLVQPEKDMVEWLMLLNHTECGCKNITVPPKCTKKCPVPFAKDKVKCSCYCKSVSMRCRDVESGFLSLQRSQLVCIKKKKCQIPKCRSGKFDVRTGFCPMSFENDFSFPLLKAKRHKTLPHSAIHHPKLFIRQFNNHRPISPIKTSRNPATSDFNQTTVLPNSTSMSSTPNNETNMP